MSSSVIALLSVDLALLAYFMYMPVMRGEDAFFGVRVSPEVYRGEGRRVLRRYRFWLALTFLEVEALGLILSLYEGRNEFAQVAPRLLLPPCAVFFYVLFYRQAKRLELVEGRRRFAASLNTRRLGDYTNLALEITVVALTVAPALALIYFYPQLPARIPVHWNWRGEPDGWARKSYFSVFSLAALLVYVQGLLLFVKHGIIGVKMTLPAEHTEAYLRLKESAAAVILRFIDRIRLLLCVLLGGLAANIAFSSVESLHFLSRIVWAAASISAALMFAAAAVAVHRFYKIDRRLREEVGRVYVQTRKDAANWHLGGLIYFNRDDPAVFVEKLVGWGYTFNLGNKWVYLYLAIMIAVPLLLFLPMGR